MQAWKRRSSSTRQLNILGEFAVPSSSLLKYPSSEVAKLGLKGDSSWRLFCSGEPFYADQYNDCLQPNLVQLKYVQSLL
ncbi:hypothetical protein Y1Q_0018381 [Alligator mississippiensis]|uniref:Uncharacterized protein n=1 Tax=Alligator mississippiensis TaxID=8496 RepID=A0A151PC02_ALLMI|nr:hypothetical protein Y1Q_0018381 [Alligator mississippiensis]